MQTHAPKVHVQHAWMVITSVRPWLSLDPHPFWVKRIVRRTFIIFFSHPFHPHTLNKLELPNNCMFVSLVCGVVNDRTRTMLSHAYLTTSPFKMNTQKNFNTKHFDDHQSSSQEVLKLLVSPLPHHTPTQVEMFCLVGRVGRTSAPLAPRLLWLI